MSTKYHDPKIPSQEELSYIDNYLEYEYATGFIYRFIEKTQLLKKIGSYNNGYLMIKILGREIYSHHIAWYLFYGKWPVMQIDHKDRDRSNNRIDNLQEATGSIQNKNKPKRKKSNRN